MEKLAALIIDRIAALTAMNKFQLAQSLHAQGRFDDAEEAYRSILAASPKKVDCLYALAVLCHQRGRSIEASEYLLRAIGILPNEAALHHGLGSVLADFGKFDDALRSYRQAVRLQPKVAGYHNDLGAALANVRRLEEARNHFKAAIELDRGFAAALDGLGFVNTISTTRLEPLKLSNKRLASIRTRPTRTNLAMSYIACGRYEDALAQFSIKIDKVRGGDISRPLTDEFRLITKPKITHDIEQLRYLDARHGSSDGRFGRHAKVYQDIEREIDWGSEPFKVSLTDEQYQRVQETYNRAFHVVDAPSIHRGALNPNLDTAAITRQYFGTGPGVCYFDELLKPEALRSLWRFLMESTIWFHIEHPEGYVGAYVDDGLACPLLLQIASNLRAALSEIFGDRQLKQLWAYKYSSTLTGINLHADDAAVNVNFWISPDSANLNPERGGLIVYFSEAPKDWEKKSVRHDSRKRRSHSRVFKKVRGRQQNGNSVQRKPGWNFQLRSVSRDR